MNEFLERIYLGIFFFLSFVRWRKIGWRDLSHSLSVRIISFFLFYSCILVNVFPSRCVKIQFSHWETRKCIYLSARPSLFYSIFSLSPFIWPGKSVIPSRYILQNGSLWISGRHIYFFSSHLKNRQFILQ